MKEERMNEPRRTRKRWKKRKEKEIGNWGKCLGKKSESLSTR
jgi:hypothetical protein